jgi:hypothetical protein
MGRLSYPGNEGKTFSGWERTGSNLHYCQRGEGDVRAEIA